MEVPTKRHFVSIDLKIDEQQSQVDAQILTKKHKLTILVGCTHRSASKISVLNNNNNQKNRMKKSTNINQVSKYYINRGQKSKQKKIDLRGLTQRKNVPNAVTVSLRKDINADKSYRVHTIQHITDSNRKENTIQLKQIKNSNNALVDITNKKRNFIEISKPKIKKNFINQAQYSQLADPRTKIQTENGIQILKCPKFNKIRTQIQQQNACKQKIKYQIKSYKHIFTQRNSIVDIKPKGSNSLSKNQKNQVQKVKNQNQLGKQNKSVTVDLKVKNNEEGKKIRDQFQEGYQGSKQQKHQNFNNYIDYIHNHKRKQTKITRKMIKSILQSRSIIVKSTIIKEQTEKQKNFEGNNKIQQPQEQTNKKQIGQCSIKKQQIIANQIDKLEFLDLNKFDCSSIPEINQSSFLSENGKKDILKFDQNTKQNNDILLQLYESKLNKKSNYALQKGNQIKRKNKRKRDSKLSLICRSEMRQAFPERFFD